MGAMKSMAWDYALFLQRKAQEQDDLDFNIDKKFQEIVNGEIDIPEEWLNNWVSRNSVFASEDVVFDAETNSWKQQNRDAKGRFVKGFADKTDAQLIEELEEKEEERRAYIEHANDEYIYNEMIAPYYQYVDLDKDMEMTGQKFGNWLENAIYDETFPDRLTDPYYFQYLQKIAESVPASMLEQLHDTLELQMNFAHHANNHEAEIIGGRGVFITGILLNLQQGQETWAAEALARHDEKWKGIRWTPEEEATLSQEEKDVIAEKIYNDWKAGKITATDVDDEYTPAEINLMRYDLVEHELENADYNYFYDLLLYGTEGWANMEDAEVVQKFRNIFER